MWEEQRKELYPTPIEPKQINPFEALEIEALQAYNSGNSERLLGIVCELINQLKTTPPQA